ncbi:MAG: hypothetical protein WCD77_02450, partial [Acidobacteriaceae bacterium]
ESRLYGAVQIFSLTHEISHLGDLVGRGINKVDAIIYKTIGELVQLLGAAGVRKPNQTALQIVFIRLEWPGRG